MLKKRPTVIVTTDGRVITASSGRNEKSATLRHSHGNDRSAEGEIDERTLSETSMMPDDQLKQFSTAEVLSLFAYLRGKAQVPCLATKENAGNFFNGKDSRLERRLTNCGRSKAERLSSKPSRDFRTTREVFAVEEFPAFSLVASMGTCALPRKYANSESTSAVENCFKLIIRHH